MRDLEFDTGLNARAFAQAKFARCLTEPGLIVRPGVSSNKVELWKASGVREAAGAGGEPTMVVWGPPVEGERLDVLLNGNEQPDKVIAAISLWIQAILVLGEDTPPGGGPRAALVAQESEDRSPFVFFAPPALIQRAVTHNDECYVNPALSGAEAAAFTAAAMLYRFFAGSLPFSAAGISTLHQDMRDGNFLPVRLAVPGLDSRLAALIQAALEWRALERSAPEQPSAACGLEEFLKIIQPNGQTVAAASLVHSLAETDRLLLEKEKTQFVKIQTASIKTRRFVAHNTSLLLGVLAVAAAAIFILYNVISSRARLPTTAGMEPVQVIESYYRCFGELDHQMMEACVSGGAGKSDINAVINLFVVTKTRQAYEHSARPLIFPAHQWEGGDLPETPMFGAADVRIEPLDNELGARELRYRVEYTFWIPAQAADTAADAVSVSYTRSDIVTLVLKKDNWRIAEINR